MKNPTNAQFNSAAKEYLQTGDYSRLFKLFQGPTRSGIVRYYLEGQPPQKAVEELKELATFLTNNLGQKYTLDQTNLKMSAALTKSTVLKHPVSRSKARKFSEMTRSECISLKSAKDRSGPLACCLSRG